MGQVNAVEFRRAPIHRRPRVSDRMEVATAYLGPTASSIGPGSKVE
jgi:hypothetical protein